ncbi:hypothetical protein BGZ65_006514, partial [Modicella reniformis]
MNPELRKLDIRYQGDRVKLMPFTNDISTALLSHQTLRFIRLKNLRADATTFEALLMHLPTVVQELDFDIDIEERHVSLPPPDFYVNTNTVTPMQLLRLNLQGSLVDHESLLISLLRRSPLLEHIKIVRLYGMALGGVIIQALIEH